MTRRAIVVGGGIGGLTAALALRSADLDVVVLERAPVISEVAAGISLWPNALNVLRRLDLADAIDAVAAVQPEGELRTWRGRRPARARLTRTTKRHNEPLLALHRAALRTALRGALDQGVLQLSADCTSVSQDPKRVSATLTDGRSVEGHVVIGADGLRSTVRTVAFGDEALRYSGFTIWRGVVPLDETLASRIHPAESRGRHALFGVTRLRSSQAFWHATVRADEHGSESTAEEKTMLLRRFAYWHDPIPELIEATPAEAIIRTSLYDRPPLRRWATGRIALLGDAARGMLPNLAQGACQAIEDAAVLADALCSSSDVAPALAAYDWHRRQHAVKPARRPLRPSHVAHPRNLH